MTKARDRVRRLLVTVNEDERAAIKAHAKASNLSVSAYLRALGLGHEPRSTIDHEAVSEVVKAHGGLAKIGGLLKLWLSERSGEGAAVAEVRAVLHGVEAAVEDVRQKVREL